VIERQSLDDVAAPVMPDSVKALVAQARHQLDEILGHRPLAGLRVVRQARRLLRVICSGRT
jgi:hypothetical protein